VPTRSFHRDRDDDVTTQTTRPVASQPITFLSPNHSHYGSHASVVVLITGRPHSRDPGDTHAVPRRIAVLHRRVHKWFGCAAMAVANIDTAPSIDMVTSSQSLGVPKRRRESTPHDFLDVKNDAPHPKRAMLSSSSMATSSLHADAATQNESEKLTLLGLPGGLSQHSFRLSLSLNLQQKSEITSTITCFRRAQYSWYTTGLITLAPSRTPCAKFRSLPASRRYARAFAANTPRSC
jgi:hypothetical protein